MLKTEAVKHFLTHKTLPDLAALYTPEMEVQVNVEQGNGERIGGEYEGKSWTGWSDGLTTWKAFRIPWNAYSEPNYTDSELRFDLSEHAVGIGLTGWNWVRKQSMWVAFDFDAIVGHSEKHQKKLTDNELKGVQEAVSDIEWVTIRKSTSGTGLHLYVFLEDAYTENHTEHAALARSILGKLAAQTAQEDDWH